YDHVLCYLFERIVRGDARIVAVLPENEHHHHCRPPDTRPAWERMGDPVRCRVSGGCEITMWPWLDLTDGREAGELLVVAVAPGGNRVTQSLDEPRRCWVPPAVRAYYREKIRSGCW